MIARIHVALLTPNFRNRGKISKISLIYFISKLIQAKNVAKNIKNFFLNLNT